MEGSPRPLPGGDTEHPGPKGPVLGFAGASPSSHPPSAPTLVQVVPFSLLHSKSVARIPHVLPGAASGNIFPNSYGLFSQESVGLGGVYLLAKRGKEKYGDRRKTNLAHTKRAILRRPDFSPGQISASTLFPQSLQLFPLLYSFSSVHLSQAVGSLSPF